MSSKTSVIDEPGRNKIAQKKKKRKEKKIGIAKGLIDLTFHCSAQHRQRNNKLWYIGDIFSLYYTGNISTIGM